MTVTDARFVAVNRIVGVLEDQAYVCHLIDRQLSVFGLEARSVTDMDEVLELAFSGRVKAFILDVQIGNVKALGLDVLERLKEVDPEIFVCVYSAYVEKPELRRRAERLHADFIKAKTADPREDLLEVGAALLKHQAEMLAVAQNLIQVELDQLRKGEHPSVEWKSEYQLRNADATDEAMGSIMRIPVTKDVNYQLQKSLLSDREWKEAHAGKTIMIVDGMVVCEADTIEEAVRRSRRDYPGKDRLLLLVEDYVERFDIPSPFEIGE